MVWVCNCSQMSITVRVVDKNLYSEPNWLTVICSLHHTQQWWANITIQLNILIVRLNCVASKWSSSYSRVCYLVFTFNFECPFMIDHTNQPLIAANVAISICVKHFNHHLINLQKITNEARKTKVFLDHFWQDISNLRLSSLLGTLVACLYRIWPPKTEKDKN